VKQLLRERAEITVLVLCLAFGQFGNHEVAVTLEYFVSRAGERQRTSRKVMSTGEVPSQLAIGLFPIQQRFRGRWQTACETKSMKQSVGRERLQILPINFRG